MKKDTALTALGTENIWRLLLQYAIPSVIAMTAASLYNMTDSIFIGHGVSALAIAGLAITFPLMNLAAAFGTLVGAGASTLMSLRLGQKDYKNANKILGNVVTLNLIVGIAYSIIVLLFLNPILYFFGASNATIQFAREYMEIITLGNVITHLYFGLNAMLRSTGNPKASMYSTIATVFINASLSYVFIFIFGWGIRGAAFATIIAQTAMLTWQIQYFCKKKNFIRFQKGAFKLNRKIIKDSLAIGMAPFLMNVAACIVIIIINKQLLKFGSDLDVGAYGIVNRVAFFFLMIVMGLNMGMQPIAGYNYGARNINRLENVLKYSIALATIIMTIGFIVGQFFPRTVATVFTTDTTLINLIVPGLHIVLVFFPIIGFQMVTSIFFESIGMVKKAIFMSLARQIVFLIPCLLILPLFFGSKGVWYSLPISDLMSSIIAGVLLTKQLKNFKSVNQSVYYEQEN